MKPIAILLVGVCMCVPTIAYAQKEGGDHKALLDRLSNGDRRAVPAVIKHGEAIFPELTKLLSTRPRDDNQSLLTYAVAEIASKIGPKAKGATPILCTLLKSQDKAVASDAARALGYIGAEAAPQVIKTLKSIEQEPEVINAVRALGNIGAGAKGSAPALIAVLKSNKNPHVRLACIDAIGVAGPLTKESLGALLDVAKDKENPKGIYTVSLIVALGNQGTGAKDAIPYLVATLRQAPEPHVKVHALEAIARISPASKHVDEAVALMFEQPHVPKIMVLESLSKGGPLSKEMVKSIEQLMRDKDAAVRLQAALVVGKTKANHPAVVSILIESLQDKDAKTRRTAAEAIGTIRPSDEAVIEALHARVNDPDSAVRAAVASALEKFKKK